MLTLKLLNCVTYVVTYVLCLWLCISITLLGKALWKESPDIDKVCLKETSIRIQLRVILMGQFIFSLNFKKLKNRTYINIHWLGFGHLKQGIYIWLYDGVINDFAMKMKIYCFLKYKLQAAKTMSLLTGVPY